MGEVDQGARRQSRVGQDSGDRPRFAPSAGSAGFAEQDDAVRVGAETVVRDAPDVGGLGESLS